MSAPPKKPKRRIAPIALTAAAPAAAAAAATPTPAVASPAPAERLPALERALRQHLSTMRDELSVMIDAPFVPLEEGLDDLDAGLRRVRACVRQYHEVAAVAEREAAAERERLASTLLPLKIERTAATARIYNRHKAAQGGEKRNLFMCPKADPSTGVCKHPPVPRAFHPCTRGKVQAHIERWHLGADALREHRFDDAFWAEGADAQRARAPPRR